MNTNAVHIRIYGKSADSLATYRLFSNALLSTRKKQNRKPIELELDRKLFDLSGTHTEPVIEVDDKIASEGKIPSNETVLKLIDRLTAAA